VNRQSFFKPPAFLRREMENPPIVQNGVDTGLQPTAQPGSLPQANDGLNRDFVSSDFDYWHK
jgi:hypothetical protein